MNLASVTIADNRESTIGAALASVAPFVDVVVVLDTGITDRTLLVASDTVGEKLRVHRFTWNNSFADARNAVLMAATLESNAWAVMVDTDEQLRLPSDLRETLAASTADYLNVAHTSGTYVQPRVFRLPARGLFQGRTHEAFVPRHRSDVLLEGAAFVDTPKTPDELRAKSVRDLPLLMQSRTEEPDDPRWVYYLGQTLEQLKDFDAAIRAYMACASLRGWDEESAWACYRAAVCAQELDQHERAIELCSAGMARHPGIAEIPWLAGISAQRLGRHHHAIYLARIALTWGCAEGHGTTVPRIGFRHPPALWEGPYDILRFSLRATGDEHGATLAEQKYTDAQTRRSA